MSRLPRRGESRRSPRAANPPAGRAGILRTEQEPPATTPTPFQEKVTVDRVVVDGRVIDRFANTVPGLTKENFRLKVDGVACPIESAEYTPAGESRSCRRHGTGNRIAKPPSGGDDDGGRHMDRRFVATDRHPLPMGDRRPERRRVHTRDAPGDPLHRHGAAFGPYCSPGLRFEPSPPHRLHDGSLARAAGGLEGAFAPVAAFRLSRRRTDARRRARPMPIDGLDRKGPDVRRPIPSGNCRAQGPSLLRLGDGEPSFVLAHRLSVRHRSDIQGPDVGLRSRHQRRLSYARGRIEAPRSGHRRALQRDLRLPRSREAKGQPCAQRKLRDRVSGSPGPTGDGTGSRSSSSVHPAIPSSAAGTAISRRAWAQVFATGRFAR